MGDRYFLKIGNGDRWEITKEEYDEGHKLMRLVQDVEFELKDAQATIRTLTAVVEQGERLVEQRDARIGELAADKLELSAQLREAREEVRGYRGHILDIDAHATPYGDIPDEPGWVGTYLLTAGALHRALGKIGRTAPKCAAEEQRDEAQKKVEALRSEIERLRTVIRELGAAEAAEPACDCHCHRCCVPIDESCPDCAESHAP